MSFSLTLSRETSRLRLNPSSGVVPTIGVPSSPIASCGVVFLWFTPLLPLIMVLLWQRPFMVLDLYLFLLLGPFGFDNRDITEVESLLARERPNGILASPVSFDARSEVVPSGRKCGRNGGWLGLGLVDLLTGLESKSLHSTSTYIMANLHRWKAKLSRSDFLQSVQVRRPAAQGLPRRLRRRQGEAGGVQGGLGLGATRCLGVVHHRSHDSLGLGEAEDIVVVEVFGNVRWLSSEAIRDLRTSNAVQAAETSPGQCNQEDDSDCCKAGKMYPTYTCSPPMSGNTQAYLTLNSFEAGGDGGGPSECDGQYHDDNTPVVALSTGWYNGGSRCLKNIRINGAKLGLKNSTSRLVTLGQVPTCDPGTGRNIDHDYQPPCPNNIVDASKAVWEALGVSKDNWGGLDITWSDA
ncbi:hypothetical protein ACLB2K_072095 [Fragaria x ananassa]